MAFRFLVIFCIAYLPAALQGQTVEIKGKAPQFAGEEMIIETTGNPITEQMIVMDTLRFAYDGNFRSVIPVKKDTWIYIHSGIFHLRMLIQPGHGYHIVLPPKTERTVSDFRNPFFQPYEAHIQVEKDYEIERTDSYVAEEDINSRIFRFDTLIENVNKELYDAFLKRQVVDSDSMIQSIEQEFSGDTSTYFSNYRRFRYGLVKINSRDVGLQYIFEHYLDSDTIDLFNPAYFELFDEMYNEFLFFFSKTESGRSLPYLINQKEDLDLLIDTLMKHDAVPNRKLATLVLLREIYSVYNKNYFRKEALISLLDSIVTKTESEETRKLATGIKERLTKLEVGQEPPAFSLPDANNKYYTPGSFSGKYLYLIFCTPSNYGCMKEFPFLQALHEAHKQYLNIVTIFVSESKEEMEEFMSKNGFTWTALYFDKNEKLLADYDVRNFPTCILIDPDGLIVQSPASLATERFELDLFRIMRSRGDL